MRKSLFALVLSFAVIPAVAHANELFNLNGTLNDGTVATGTILIASDGSAGTSNLKFTNSGANTSYNLVTVVGAQTYDGFVYFDFNNGVVRSEIEFNLPSLVGYNGGGICTLNDKCPGGNASNFFRPGDDGPHAPNYLTGTLTAAAATPEPSSLVLLGTGIFGMIGVARRKFSV